MRLSEFIVSHMESILAEFEGEQTTAVETAAPGPASCAAAAPSCACSAALLTTSGRPASSAMKASRAGG